MGGGPKKWQGDAPFVEALKARQYLGADGKPNMSAGIYLYLWELWQDGVEHGQADLAAVTETAKQRGVWLDRIGEALGLGRGASSEEIVAKAADRMEARS